MEPNRTAFAALDDIFAPLSFEEFLRHYWSREFLHLTGPPEKFGNLFTWSVLSQFLEQHRVDERRIALVKSAKTLKPERYLNGPQIDSDKLIAELSNGATLVFNRCEEVHAPLRDLCVALGRVFHHKVFVNLYAGWRRDNGFDVHWDSHNTFILQVSGRKQWKVWKPTRLYPLREDVEDTLNPPSDAPIWEGVLQPGSLLSIPRGWWHIAYPMDEACLHLTVTLKTPVGIDLLHWLADRMKSSDAARMDIPVVGTAADRAEWLARVRADLLAALDDIPIDRFLADSESRIPPRPAISLPQDVGPDKNSLKTSMMLQLAAPEPLKFVAGEGKTICNVGGSVFQMDSDIAEKMRIFNDRFPHSIDELSSQPDLRVTALIGAMVMKGILKKTDTPL